MDNMTCQPKPSLREKWHQYSQICCKVTDTVSTTAYKAWKHALIVKNQSLSPSKSLKKNLHWTTNVSTHTCADVFKPTNTISEDVFLYLLYNTCFFFQQGDCVSNSERLRRCPIVLLSGWLLASGSFMTHGAGALSARLSSSCPLSWLWLNQVALMQQWWWSQAAYWRD